MIMPFNPDQARQAVIKVGGGRGFVVEIVEDIHFKEELRFIDHRFVVTAAHCLPHLPPALGVGDRTEHIYLSLLGPLCESKPSIATQCVFVDPVADIAVLGRPDGKEQGEEADAFDELIDTATVLPVNDCNLPKGGDGWLLSLDGDWGKCKIETRGAWLWVTEATTGFIGGMSGSPILTENGQAVGVVTTSFGNANERHTHGPQSRLGECLPRRFLRGLMQKQRRLRTKTKVE